MIYTCATFTPKWNFKGRKSEYGKSSYEDYLITFIKSLAEHHGKEPLTLYLINTGDAEHLKKLHPNITINYREVDLKGDSLKNYAVCYCTKGMVDLIHDNPYVMYIDADTIIRKPIPELFIFPHTARSFLSVMHRPHLRQVRNYFQAGVILANSTLETQLMMDMWDRYTWEALRMTDAWFHDQRCLYKVWHVQRHEVELLALEYLYNDWHFLDESSIWHCKGHGDNPKWQAEFKKYHAMAVECLK